MTESERLWHAVADWEIAVRDAEEDLRTAILEDVEPLKQRLAEARSELQEMRTKYDSSLRLESVTHAD